MGRMTRHNKTSPSEYLALLSIKYGVDVDEFFNALVSAVENRKSTCGNLSIECRGQHKSGIVLLITKGSKVVAQFPIPEALLFGRNAIREARKILAFHRHPIKNDRNLRLFQIKDLRIGMKGVNLKAEILEISKPTSVLTRFGDYANVANALISDGTGQVKLCLWNEQIDSVSAGDLVQINDAKISAFRGERNMRIAKNGTLRVVRAHV